MMTRTRRATGRPDRPVRPGRSSRLAERRTPRGFLQIELAGLLLLLLAALTACGGDGPDRLLLISLDTAAPARMGVYGGPRENTPNLRRLAVEGVRFDAATSPAPWTLPAHASLLTGRYPSSLTANPHKERGLLQGPEPLLAELFHQAGYRTGAVTGGGNVAGDLGFSRGFETYRRGSVADAVRWIEAHGDEPFFFFFHTYAPHTPFRDRRYAENLEGGRLEGIYAQESWQALHAEVCCEGFRPTKAEREFLLALYDGGVAHADEMVGALLDALERSDIRDRTVVVVTSDHGEEFWEHTGRAAYHGHSLYHELLHVPLLWWDPGLGGDRVVAEAVNLIDLVPTLAARFSLPTPEDLDGRDLTPLLTGEEWSVDRPLFGEAVRHGPARRSVSTKAGKLIHTPEPHEQAGEGALWPVPVRAPIELYLPDDAGETADASAEHPGRVEELLRRIETHRANETEVHRPAPEIGEETRRRLRELGYLE